MLLIVGLFIGALLTYAHHTRCRDTFISPGTVFLSSVFFYLIAIPLEIAITGSRYLVWEGLHVPVSEGHAIRIVAAALTGGIAFIVGYLLLVDRGSRVEDVVARPSESLRRSRNALMIVAAVGVVGVAVFFTDSVVAAGSYEANVALVANDSSYALIVRWTVQAYAMWLFLTIYTRKAGILRAMLLALPLVAWGLYSSDKDPILIAAFGLTALYVRNAERIRSIRLFGLTWVAVLGALAVSTVAFSLNRGGSSLSIGEYVARSGGFLTRMEPAGPLLSVLWSESSTPDGYIYGTSVLRNAVLWIPRFIWPDRPYDLAQTFAMENMPNWSPGRGYGYSLLAEGFLNGGLIGVAVLFWLVGAGFAWLRNRLLAGRLTLGVQGANLAFLYVVVLYVAFISLRGPSSLITTSLIQSLGLYVCIGIALKVSYGAGSRLGKVS